MILLTVILAACLLEYAGHRWLLHGSGTYYWIHVGEHHGKRMMDDDHTEYSWTLVSIVAVTTVLPLALLSVGVALMWLNVLLWIKLANRCVHRYAHGQPWKLSSRFVCPWADWCAAHHQRHHREPKVCYGMLFPWTDYLFGTF